MRPWSLQACRHALPSSSSSLPASDTSRRREDTWMKAAGGLTTVVKDARLHDALQSMYIPPSLLRIGSTIGRGRYNIALITCGSGRKCADTIVTVLVPWAGHFQRKNINIFFRKIYESNSVKRHSETVMVCIK